MDSYCNIHGKYAQHFWSDNLKGKDLLYGLVAKFLATDPEIRVRSPVLADYLRSRGSGTGSTQPRE
jgi:hypothetical protein